MSAPTTISKRHVIVIALLGIVLVFSLLKWRTVPLGHSKASDSHRKTAMANEPLAASSGPADPTRTKSRFRPNHPKPTIEETTELLHTTIIPVIDLPPDQPLPERIARMNELIQNAGVEPHRLRLLLRSGDPVNQLRCKDEMRIREIPLGIALKYLFSSTKVRCRLRENGIVELTTSQDPDTEEPTAEPESSKDNPTATEEDDPFANPGADPFAEPATAH